MSMARYDINRIRDVVRSILTEMCIDVPKGFIRWCKKRGYEEIDMLPTWMVMDLYKEYQGEIEKNKNRIR